MTTQTPFSSNTDVGAISEYYLFVLVVSSSSQTKKPRTEHTYTTRCFSREIIARKGNGSVVSTVDHPSFRALFVMQSKDVVTGTNFAQNMIVVFWYQDTV